MIDERVGVQLFSATTGQGLDELNEVMANWFGANSQSEGEIDNPGQ